MKKIIILLLLGFIAIILQTSLLRYLGSFKPNLILILVIYLGIFYEYKKGAMVSFLLGYLMDIFSGSIVGLNTFINLIIFNLIILMREKFIFEGTILNISLIALMSIIQRTGIVLILQILSPSNNLYQYIDNLIPYFLSNVIIGIIIFYLLRRMVGIS